MREVVIASSVRTAVGKSGKGTLRATRPDDLAAVAIKGALDRIPQLDKKEIEDVIIGCATPEAEQGMNVARIASLRAGLPVEVSAMTINRFCSSGLQAISLAVDSVAAGRAEVAIGGGTESMSMIPMGGNKVSINPWLMDNYPDSYLSMGLDRGAAGQTIWHHPPAGRRVFPEQPQEGHRGHPGVVSSKMRSCRCRSVLPLRTGPSPSVWKLYSRSMKVPARNRRWKRWRR